MNIKKQIIISMCTSKKWLLLALFALTGALHSDVIFWDVNGTLTDVNNGAVFFRHVGIPSTLACLATFSWQFPFENPVRHMQQRFLETVNQVPCDRCTDYCIYSDDGITQLPALLHNYMLGAITYEEAQKVWFEWVNNNPNFFINRFDRDFICKAFEVSFNPEVFVSFNQELPTVNLLAQCAQQTDAQGNKKNVCIILSNWSADAVQTFKKRFADSIMKHIDACIFSGEIHCAKPDRSFYDYVYDFVAQNYPEQLSQKWFFFDDQAINLQKASLFIGRSLFCALPQNAEAILKQQQVIA